MSIFAMVMIWILLARVLGRRTRRMRRAYLGIHGPFMFAGPVQLGYRRRNLMSAVPASPAPPAVPQPTPFEQLKTRYVNGDISDEQYEMELDALLKTPEGRRSLN